MDETCATFKDEFNCNQFLKQLNLLHQPLTFTHEKEVNGKLPFLDVLVDKSNSKFLILCTGNLHFAASTIAGIRLDLKAEKAIS